MYVYYNDSPFLVDNLVLKGHFANESIKKMYVYYDDLIFLVDDRRTESNIIKASLLKQVGVYTLEIQLETFLFTWLEFCTEA